MPVQQTDEWLSRNFREPAKICRLFMDSFSENNSQRIYQYLKLHGMYTPSTTAQKILDELNESDVWKQTEQILNKYKNLWNGPDIPVYIFPLNVHRGFRKNRENKSGLAFIDKLFLFLSSDCSDQELEALFVHEYHHVCRLGSQKQNDENSTLLDSMIMEGLAEQAVLNHVGKEFLANWTKLYSDQEMGRLWQKYVKKNVDIPRSHQLHDKILLGKAPYPEMLGYCIGFRLVNQKGLVPVKSSFSISAKEYLPT
jgi:uncharacterized protein YjaZ